MAVSLDEFQKGAVDFCSRLIRIESPAGGESDVVKAIAEEMRKLGFDQVEIDRTGNVVGRVDSKNGQGKTVLFDGHVDNVGVSDRDQWREDPFGGAIHDGRIWGRGASDMKGSVAAMVYAAGYLAAAGLESGSVAISGTVCEEWYEGASLQTVLENHRPDRVVIGESTGLKLALGQRGRMEVVIETEGVAAHSSTPHLGVSAVEKMADILVALRKLETPKDSLLGPGVLVLTDIISSPYPAISIVPHMCRATFDRRFIVSETAESVTAGVRSPRSARCS